MQFSPNIWVILNRNRKRFLNGVFTASTSRG